MKRINLQCVIQQQGSGCTRIQSVKSGKSASQYKMQMAIKRKLGMDINQFNRASEIAVKEVQVDKKDEKPKTNQASLKYFMKKINKHSRSNVSNIDQMTATQPGLGNYSEIETLQQQSYRNYLQIKNQGNSESVQYQKIEGPCLISNKNDVFVEELSSSICALANQPDGGSLLICQKHQNSTILQGIRNFSWKDERKLRQSIQNALNSINGHTNIQAKIQVLPIYSNLKQKIQEKQGTSLIIKINIAPKPGTKNLFYVEHRVEKFKQPILTFHVVGRNSDDNVRKYFVQNIVGTQIYQLMRKTYLIRSRVIKKVQKSNMQTQKIIFKLEKHLQNDSDKVTNSFNNSSLLSSLLTQMSKLGRKQIQHQFKDVNPNQTIVQFQFNDKFDIQDSIRTIEQIFFETKTKYRIIFPLRELQKELIKFKLSLSPVAPMYFVCYFVFEGSFQDFRLNARKVFGQQFDSRVIMNEVTVNVKTGVSINSDDMQRYINFLWKFFDTIPKLKKKKDCYGDYISQAKIMKQKGNKEQMFKFVELIFSQMDINVAVFTFFLLTLAKKKPD